MLQEFLKRLGGLTGKTYTAEEFKQIIIEAVGQEELTETLKALESEITTKLAKIEEIGANLEAMAKAKLEEKDED